MLALTSFESARARGLRVVAMAALAMLVSFGAQAQEATAAGVWEGRYTCGQGVTGLTLTVRPVDKSRVAALFRFYATQDNPDVPEGCFEMAGTYDPGTRRVELLAGRWLLRPFGYVSVDLSGTVSRSGGAMLGTVAGPLCTRFELRRVPAAPEAASPACRGGNVTASLAAE